MSKIVFMAGTRPEAIKLAPVVRYFKENTSNHEIKLCSSGQHKEMLAQALQDFELSPDLDLEVMTPGQTLSSLSSKLFTAVDTMLNAENPDWIIVQGDTTTVMIASLCAFYRGVKVGHVEAGLRSFDRLRPFPEEIDRRVAGLVADMHFAPTHGARNSLLQEPEACQRDPGPLPGSCSHHSAAIQELCKAHGVLHPDIDGLRRYPGRGAQPWQAGTCHA